MTVKNKHLERLEKMRQVREKRAPRPLASPSTMTAFFDGQVDQDFIDGCGSEKAFIAQLEDIDPITTQREAQALLDSLNTGAP